MKTTTFQGHAATFAQKLCLKSRVSCFRRRRRRRRWRARSRRHRRTRHGKHNNITIFFLSLSSVLSKTFRCDDFVSQKKKQKTSEKNERSKRVTKRGFANRKNTQKKQRPERERFLRVF
jgi:hypothetical protein